MFVAVLIPASTINNAAVTNNTFATPFDFSNSAILTSKLIQAIIFIRKLYAKFLINSRTF